LSNDPGAPPLPAEYGAIRPGVDEATPMPLLRGRATRPDSARRGAPDSGRRSSADPERRTPAPGDSRRPSSSDATATHRAVRVPPDGEGEDMIRGRRLHRERIQVVRGRRSRRIVRRVDTWTVAKVSMMFYLCALLVIVIAGIILWNLASAFGIIHSIDRSIRSLFAYQSFTLHAGAVLEYTVAAGFLLAIVGTIINTLAATVYNLISDVIGGVQVVVVADDEVDD